MSDTPYVQGRASGNSVSRRRVWPMRALTGGGCSVAEDLSSRTSQFQHIVGTADQTPLTGDLRLAPQQELSESASLFDLTKHGFDHLLA